MERFRFSCSVDEGNRALVARFGGERKRQQRAREMNTEEIARWRRKRWMTVERMRNVDRMLYQTGRLPSLFRIRMCVRLTYSCTRTASRYPLYSPFRVFSPRTRAHAHSHREAVEEYLCAYLKGWRKMKKRGRRKQSACTGGRALYIKSKEGIIMFARSKSTPVGIDLWSGECMLIFCALSPLLPSLVTREYLSRPLAGHARFGHLFFMKKAIFIFMFSIINILFQRSRYIMKKRK